MNVPTMPLWTSGGVPPAYMDMTLAFQLALPALTRLIVTPGFALTKFGIATFSSQGFSRGSLRTSQVRLPPAPPLGLAAAGGAAGAAAGFSGGGFAPALCAPSAAGFAAAGVGGAAVGAAGAPQAASSPVAPSSRPRRRVVRREIISLTPPERTSLALHAGDDDS